MKKEIYYCDVCNKEVDDYLLIKEDVPIINRIQAKNSSGAILLDFGTTIDFEEQEFCPECKQKYEQIWTKYMTMLAQEWRYQVNMIKSI